jgi:outer membrane protein TolC
MEARGAGRPQLNLSSGATISSRELGFPLAVALNEQQQLIFQEVPLYPDRTGYAAAGVSQVIDISGLIRTGITTASLGKQVAQRNVQSTRNGVLFQVKAAYYDVLHAQALTAVAQEAVDNAQTRRKTAQALVEAGISSRVDIFRADAAIAAAQQSLIAAQNAVEVSKAGLNDLLGRDVNTPLEVQSLRKRSRL